MGYQEAVTLGSEYIAQRQLGGARLNSAEEIHPNVWCVRFGITKQGSARVLQLYFDGTNRRLIKSEEVEAVAAPATPSFTENK
jgi:hypothetical protein